MKTYDEAMSTMYAQIEYNPKDPAGFNRAWNESEEWAKVQQERLERFTPLAQEIHTNPLTNELLTKMFEDSRLQVDSDETPNIARLMMTIWVNGVFIGMLMERQEAEPA